MGNRTCGGFAGGWRHEELDAATYVDWGVKYFMHDTCWDFAEPGRYGTFRLSFHHFDRFELDLRGHIHVRGAAFSCLRLKLANVVLI